MEVFSEINNPKINSNIHQNIEEENNEWCFFGKSITLGENKISIKILKPNSHIDKLLKLQNKKYEELENNNKGIF